MRRAPLDVSDGRPTSGADLNLARQLVERSGILEVLGPFVDSEIGRPRHLSLLGFLVACQLNAFHRHHQAHLVEVTRVLNALTDEQRRSVGICCWDQSGSSARTERLFVKLCAVLDSGEAGVDAQWFAD